MTPDTNRRNDRGVYNVCMARLNVYVPDDLAVAAREAQLNVSALTQEALRAALRRGATDRWLSRLGRGSSGTVSHQVAMAALEEAREELGG